MTAHDELVKALWAEYHDISYRKRTPPPAPTKPVSPIPVHPLARADADYHRVAEDPFFVGYHATRFQEGAKYPLAARCYELLRYRSQSIERKSSDGR